MAAVKKSIYISEELLKEADAISSNFSAVVEMALMDYIHQCKVQKARQSFGKWAVRTESSVDIVNTLRREDDRNFTDVDNKMERDDE